MNKGLKKGLGALAAVASLLALGPLAAANAAQPTRTRIDAFANDGTIAVESADGRTDISKHTINAYLLAPYTSAVATGDTLNEYAVSTGTGYADKVTTAVKAAFPDADKGADGWQVALGDATTTLDEANPMDWVARNLLDSDASPWAGGLRDFVTKLTASLKGNNAFPADAKTLTPTAGAPAKQTADGLTPGIYLILDTAIGSESAAPSLAVTTFGTVTKYSFAKDGQAQPATGDLGKVEYKVLPYETAKAIESVRGSATAEVADDGASAKANIGDVINYRVQVGPIWTTGYDAGRTLKASDSLNAGQTFDISSVKAYTYDAPADGGALDEATKQTLVPAKADKDGNRTVWALDDRGTKADYSVTATKGGDGTTVAFGFYNENNLLDADAAKFEGKVVVLEYSAKLNRNAVVGGTGNENAVTWDHRQQPAGPDQHRREDRQDPCLHVLRPHRQDRQRHQGRHRRCRVRRHGQGRQGRQVHEAGRRHLRRGRLHRHVRARPHHRQQQDAERRRDHHQGPVRRGLHLHRGQGPGGLHRSAAAFLQGERHP